MPSSQNRPSDVHQQTQERPPPHEPRPDQQTNVPPNSTAQSRAKARAAVVNQLERETSLQDQADMAANRQAQLVWKKLITTLLSYDVDLDRAVRAGAQIADVAEIVHIQDLRALMRMNDTFVMGVIAEPLARLQGAHALPLLFHTLRCIEIEGVDGASLAKLIGHVIQTQPNLSFQILMQLLGDASQIIRRDAVWAMSFLPQALALPPLMSMLGDSRREVRIAAVNALKYFQIPAVVDALVTALRDWEAEVRCAAASALGWICEPRTFNALVAATTDQDPLVRSFVYEALQKLHARWLQPSAQAPHQQPPG